MCTHTHTNTHTHALTYKEMVTTTCALLVLLTVLCVPSVYGYSAGAREESCYNMEAAHVNTLTVMNVSSNNCFQFGDCQFTLDVLAKVDYDDRRAEIDVDISSYECGEVYQSK